MNDLIYRQDTLDVIDRVTESHNSVESITICAEARLELLTLPSAEPKKGKWLPHPGYRDWDVCSACGIGCKRREYGLMPYGAKEWMTEYSYQYCPNCGAKMEVTEGI